MPEARARPWVTYALITANVAMFGIEIAHGASPTAPTPQQIIDLGGSYPPLTLNGEWWRLGSSMFLHFGILHIALNMVCLYQARVVELLFGHLGFLVIYLLAGLGGGIASLIVSAGNAVNAGASGAVFGAYGAFGAFLVLRRSQIDAEVWQRTARSIGGFLVLNLVVGLAAPGVSLSAHAGGLLVGFGLGAALLAGAGATRHRARRVVGLAVLGAALTGVAVMSLHAAPALPPVLGKFYAVERASVERWNEALSRSKAGALGDAELADLLEHDVIAPYAELRRAVLATSDIPEPLRPLFHTLDDYMAAHLTAWQLFDAVLREPDPEKRRPRLDEYRAHDAVLARARAAFEAELERLRD
jgi:rhomboid protease GluP